MDADVKIAVESETPTTELVISVTFKEYTKVRDALEALASDGDWAKAISRNVVSWDLVDGEGGPIPLPDADTDSWYLEISLAQWVGLIHAWSEWRTRDLKKANVMK